MATSHQPPPSEEAVTAGDVEFAERRARDARERAALAGFSAAKSFEESARRHERFAKVQDETVRQGVSEVEAHRQSAIRHRKAAADDRHLAELKRQESRTDLSLDGDH